MQYKPFKKLGLKSWLNHIKSYAMHQKLKNIQNLTFCLAILTYIHNFTIYNPVSISSQVLFQGNMNHWPFHLLYSCLFYHCLERFIAGSGLSEDGRSTRSLY